MNIRKLNSKESFVVKFKKDICDEFCFGLKATDVFVIFQLEWF